ncbi:hypothetical protein TB1_037659 [Malus domestica]
MNWQIVSTCFEVSFSLPLFVPQADVVDEEETQDDEDEYSRARLGKQSGRGSRQLAPDRKINTKCWLITLFLLVLKQRQGEGQGEA